MTQISLLGESWGVVGISGHSSDSDMPMVNVFLGVCGKNADIGVWFSRSAVIPIMRGSILCLEEIICQEVFYALCCPG